MKSRYIVLTVFLIILAVSVTGCGGSKSSGPIPHAPSLSGLYLFPSSVDQYTGNGTTDVYYQFDFTDAGGDLASMTIAVYDANGIELDSATDTIEGADGITDGFIYGYIPADTTVAGNYAIKFSMTDSQGKTSNVVNATFTVIPVASVVSIDVTPANPTILKYGSQQFTATANYDDGTKLNVTTLSSWTSSDTGVATIISWSGLAAGATGGSSTITALFSGVSGSTTLTVADMPLVSLSVTPQGPSINKGATQQLTATGTYANDMTLNITTRASWTSSAPAVASVDSGGVVTAIAGGSAVITATSGTIQGSSTVHVVADFGPAARYPSDSSFVPGTTAIGDLNGDGRKDIAVIEGFNGYNSGNQIALHYQNADHTLDAQQLITTDLSLHGVAIADVNSDGLDELVVDGRVDIGMVTIGKVYVYTQDPVTHALNAPQQYTLSTWGVVGMAVADLNNDGRPDIVVSGEGYAGSVVVSFLFQSLAGTLASEATYTAVSVYQGGELHVADMNNDGMNDIVLQSGAKQLAVIKQVSPGQFSTSPDYYTVQTSYASLFYSFTLGDINADGLTDIAVADIGNNSNLNTFLQNSSGQMNGPNFMSTGNLGQSVVYISNTNEDGLNDIIVVNNTLVRIMHQATDHTFPDFIDYVLPSDTIIGLPLHMSGAIGDVTGDGLPDIVTTWLLDLYVLPHAQ